MTTPSTSDLLRLMAHDGEDLEVIASVLQDSLTRPSLIVYHKHQLSLTLAMNRFCWEQVRQETQHDDSSAQEKNTPQAPSKRVWSLVRVEDVLEVKARNFPAQDSQQPVQFLTMFFTPHEHAEKAPGGFLHLVFAGGAELSLEVEAINITLMDISEHWEALSMPEHS